MLIEQHFYILIINYYYKLFSILYCLNREHM